MLPTLQQELAEITLTPDEAVPEELEAYSQLSDEDKLAWHTQDALVQQLPAALVKSFQKVQEQFHENTQVLLITSSNRSASSYHSNSDLATDLLTPCYHSKGQWVHDNIFTPSLFPL